MKTPEFKLYAVLSNMTGIPVADINVKSRLTEDLKCDSLDLIELTMAIENEFSISISEPDLDNMKTVADIVALLAKHNVMEAPVYDPKNPKFGINWNVRHLKTGGIYKIKGLPANYRIEATGEPAYAYLDEEEDKVWVRPQAEMEDGRFEVNRVDVGVYHG